MTMFGTFVTSQLGTNLLRDQDGYKYRTYQTISSGTVLKMRCTKQKPPIRCPAVAYIVKGSNPPQITKLTNQHNHGAEVIADEVRTLEQDAIKSAALSG